MLRRQSIDATAVRPFVMAKILRFPIPDRRLRSALEQARDDAERIAEELHFRAITLATESVWREWSDSVPDGTVCTFDSDELHDCGDATVRELVVLERAAIRVVEGIEARLSAGKRAPDE